jgi:hypothetical protein
MAIPTKGTRRIVVDGATYRWRVDYDRNAWDKGLLTDVRVVIQAVPAGQILIADFMGSHHENGDPLNLPFVPSFARKLIEAGLARGWRPMERIHAPVTMDEDGVRTAASSGSSQ